MPVKKRANKVKTRATQQSENTSHKVKTRANYFCDQTTTPRCFTSVNFFTRFSFVFQSVFQFVFHDVFHYVFHFFFHYVFSTFFITFFSTVFITFGVCLFGPMFALYFAKSNCKTFIIHECSSASKNHLFFHFFYFDT